MNKTLSVYLDLVRFAAAFVVLVGHLSGRRFTAGVGWQVAPFMADAVAIFFVLSGYVIAMVSAGREGDWRSYLAGRSARVLSVAVPALAITFVLDAWGRHAFAGSYASWWGFQGDGLAQFVPAATFSGQVWWLDVDPGSDLPWWSLCYEVWYYLVFALWTFGGSRRVVLAGIGLLIAGPAIAAMLPLWLLGVACHRASWPERLRPRAAAAFGAAVAAGVIALAVVLLLGLLPQAGIAGVTKHMDPLRSYLSGAGFGATILAVRLAHRSGAVRAAAAACGPAIRRVASFTFTIYLLHLPVAQWISAAFHIDPASVSGRVFVLFGTLALMVPCAAVGEHRKAMWHRAIGRLLGVGVFRRAGA